MSRHRSPGGVPRIPARHRSSTQSAVRNGLTAAAAAGGALAVIVPTVATTTPAAAVDDLAVLRLSAGEDQLSAGGDQLPAAGDRASAGQIRLISSIVPVADVREDGPVGVTELLKAAGLADVARKAEEEQAAREAAAACDADLGALGQVKPWVRDAARFLSCLYGRPDMQGVAGRGRQSDHPSGHAVDLMARGERGDRIADCALANQDELGISYVIWKQRINFGEGWERMADRGGDTENHMDHVHVSFERSPGSGDPVAARCG